MSNITLEEEIEKFKNIKVFKQVISIYFYRMM